MTISLTKSDILSQANELYGRLTQEQTRIAQLSPQEQISAISLLPLEASLFTDLQQKVENIARGQMQTAYGFSDEEWNALSETLIKSAEALGVIEDNGVIATSYEDINSQITGLQSQTNPNRNEVTSLQERIQNIFEQYAYSINFKNREVLEASLLKLRTLAQKAAAPIQNHSNDPSSTSQIRNMQDEEYDASLFTNQLGNLQEIIGNDPLNDFEFALSYYIRITTYTRSKPHYQYQSIPAGIAIMGCLRKVEELLQTIIATQAKNEEAQAQTQPDQSQILKELLEAVSQTSQAQAQNSNIKQHQTNMNEVFKKLSSEAKEKLFNALNKIQKIKTQRDLAKTVIGQAFAIWPTTLGDKKQAIENILLDSNAPAAPVIVKHADEMNRRFLDIKNQQPPLLPTQRISPSSQRNIELPPLQKEEDDDDTGFIYIGAPEPNRDPQPDQRIKPNIPKEWYLPPDIDIGSLHLDDVIPTERNELTNPEVHPGNTLMIQDLLEFLSLLGPNASIPQLQTVCQSLHIMDSKGVKSVFQISDTQPRSVADRPFYHLYLIHKNESPDNLVADGQYGNKAFAGVYPATNEERFRAVQRTIVELALESLEDAINFDDSATLNKLLNILESVKLNDKDRAEGQENAAYNLFGAFYHLHAAAYSNQSSLIDPEHVQFNGDFGRVAFQNTMQGIDPSIKIAAINQVRNAFKAAWKQ